jgi:SnoaL-like protein
MCDIGDITQLVLKERQGREHGWWDQMEACFHPDSTVNLSAIRGTGPEFVAQSRQIAARERPWVQRLWAPIVHVHGDRAVAEVSATFESGFALDGVDVYLTLYVRVLYRVRRFAAGWLIVSLDCVYQRDTLAAADPGATVPVDHDELARYRPSYRFFAYHAHRAGRTMPADLYGDDRPADVAALYQKAHAWLAG